MTSRESALAVAKNLSSSSFPAIRAGSRAGALSMLMALIALALAVSLVGPGQPPPVFRLGVQSWSGYAPGYLAHADGEWPEGLIKPVELMTDAEVVRAMRSGVLEAGCMTLDGALRVQASGIDIRLVQALDFSDGSDAILSVNGEVVTMASLRDKVVAVERQGMGMLFLARALQDSNLTLSQIKVLNADMPEHERLIASHRVDAVVTYSPHKDRFVKQGARVLRDSSTMTGNVIDVLVVRADAFEKNPRAVRELVRGWEAAAGRLESSQPSRKTVAKAMGMTIEEYEDGCRQIRIPTTAESHRLLGGNLPGLADSARETQDSLLKFGLIDSRLDANRLLLTPSEQRALKW